MTAKLKFIIGAVLVLGSAGWLMVSSISSTGSYYFTPQELAAKVSRDPSIHETGVKLGARVVPGTVERAPGGREVRFRVSDGTQDYAVHYRGLIPDTFTDSVDVVVDGRLGRDGTFRATTLVAKCGARFESAPPEAYQRVMGATRQS
jgi:cytochrome c-type biogenesis protein CcmE